jgi:hypothetical protein
MRRPALVLALALPLAAAAPALAGTVTVQVPAPPATRAAQLAPPLVLAYPLDAGRAWVSVPAPRGRARLDLAPGPWIVATRFLTPRGRARYRSQLVQVAGRPASVRVESAGPTFTSIELGTIRLTDPSFRNVPPISDDWTDISTAAASIPSGDPCRPVTVPPRPLSRNPMWNVLLQGMQRASSSGPSAVRAKAAATARRLRGGPRGSLRLNGEVTSITADGTFTGTYRLTDKDGRTVAQREVTGNVRGKGAGVAYFQAAFAELVKDLCAPAQITVDARLRLNAKSNEAEGEAVLTFEAFGRERLGPDGRVERGNYEYQRPTRWVVESESLRAPAGARCPIAPTGIEFVGNEYGPPTALATAGGAGFRVALIVNALQGYTFLSPCSGGNGLPITISTLVSGTGTPTPQGITVEVPEPGRVVSTGRQGSLAGVAGEFVLEVIVRRLPRP